MILDSTSKEHYDPTQIAAVMNVFVLHNLRYISTSISSFPVLDMMPLLRHVDLSSIFSVPDPPSDDFVLGNLQSVSIVRLSECREKVVKGIPNIKKLKITCEELDRKSLYCFNNLCHIDKLEHLSCDFQMFPSCPVLQQSNLLRSILIFDDDSDEDEDDDNEGACKQDDDDDDDDDDEGDCKQNDDSDEDEDEDDDDEGACKQDDNSNKDGDDVICIQLCLTSPPISFSHTNNTVV
ncbi:hypothetical protein ACS0TY_035398 [Phlomoides rotata]